MAEFARTDIVSLATTVGSPEDARRLAQALVARRLAACVQIEPGLESHYRWEGRDCADPEIRLTIKTAPERLGDLLAFLDEQHPYDVPQLLWQLLQASEAYASWVRSEVGLA